MNIVIVGGGFGGVKAALELSKKKKHSITLISNSDKFQYYPTLFSAATGHSYKESWIPLDTIVGKRKNITIVHDEITSIDKAAKKVISASKEYAYDKVIFALGSVTTYFGIEGLDVYAYGIKSEGEIRKLQAHLWQQLSDGIEDEKNYVIIGGGPTGVELAGALGEYIKKLYKHFNIPADSTKLNISLIEAAPRLLPRLCESTSRRALERLQRLGINVELDMKVEKQTADSLIVNGKPMMTQTVIWTSGVANAPFYKQNEADFPLNERGKVNVDEYMRASEDVYVIGDNANTPYAGLAQTALHDAQFVARHIEGSTKPYKSVPPACVVPIGHDWAVFEWGKIRFGGKLGNMMRNFADMIGYHDILPIGMAFSTWRAESKQELRIPDKF